VSSNDVKTGGLSCLVSFANRKGHNRRVFHRVIILATGLEFPCQRLIGSQTFKAAVLELGNAIVHRMEGIRRGSYEFASLLGKRDVTREIRGHLANTHFATQRQ